MASPNTKKQSADKISANELYNTPDIALESLDQQFPEVFKQYNKFYDPCNGLGKISNYLKSIGKECITSDIVDYGCQDFLGDFLQLEELPKGVDCVIFNPPFTLTEKFIDKFYELSYKYDDPTKVSLLMFNRMTTIESNSRASKFKSREWTLADMYQFGFRVSCSKGVEQEPTANSVAFAWFSFNCTFMPPQLHWITKGE